MITIDAVDHRSGDAVRLTCVDGKIKALEPLGLMATGLPVLLPPLVDIQINGFAGVDFQNDTCTREELEQAAGGGDLVGTGPTQFRPLTQVRRTGQHANFRVVFPGDANDFLGALVFGDDKFVNRQMDCSFNC